MPATGFAAATRTIELPALPASTVPVPSWSWSAVVTVVPAVTTTRLRLYSDVPPRLSIAHLALIRLLPLVGYFAEG